MSFGLSARSKGLRAIDRAFSIASRFGLTDSRMTDALSLYLKVLRDHDATATFPVTAVVLRRHRALLARLPDEGIELAVHGLVHNDYAAMSQQRQHDQLRKAVGIFESAGIAISGFRGPYLRSNGSTDTVLRELGFVYHCGRPVAFPVPNLAPRGAGARAYARAMRLYTPSDARRVALRPRTREGLIDIPVMLPDDEILVDRLRFGTAKQSIAWLEVLDQTYLRSGIFTLQLHPERVCGSAEALEAVLDHARGLSPAVWIARLDDIARWWQRRANCRLIVTESDGGRYQVLLVGDARATLLVRGIDRAPTRDWYGRDSVATSPGFFVECALKPVVGLSSRTEPEIQAFLAEEGFPFEVSDESTKFGAFLDLPARSWNEADILSTLEASNGPLVRLGRWPQGCRSALAVTGDIDSITMGDFIWRVWETWR